MATFESTYLALDTPHRWLRGNHHGHSTVSDGDVAPNSSRVPSARSTQLRPTAPGRPPATPNGAIRR